MGGANYEFRIAGRVSDSQMPIFEGLSVATEPVETVVHGPLPDQDAVYELLLKLQALGLEVVGFRLLPGGDQRQPRRLGLVTFTPEISRGRG